MIKTQLSALDPVCPAPEGEKSMIVTENASIGSLPSWSSRIGTLKHIVTVEPSSLDVNVNMSVVVE